MGSPDFEFIVRHEVLCTPDFEFDIDEYKRASGEQFLLAHILVHRWSPSVLKGILRHWVLFRRVVTSPLYAVPKVYDARWRKFVTKLGFKPLLPEVTCNNGASRPLYIHVTKDADVGTKRNHLQFVNDAVGPTGRCADDGV